MHEESVYRAVRKVGVSSKQRSAVMFAALTIASLSATAKLPVALEGRYVAVSIVEATTPEPPSPKDIHLAIKVRDEHLVLRWQSLPHRAGEPAHHYRAIFEESQRPGIYIAGMRCDRFGHSRPLDPGAGEPYMWVYVGNQGITLYTMSIADNGTHDLRLYRYRRKGEGLALTFERVRDDAPVERIEASLERARVEVRPAEPPGRQATERHIGARCG